MSRDITCAKCSVLFTQGGPGRPRRFCLKCSPPRPKNGSVRPQLGECPVCSGPVVRRDRGRSRVYCSPDCKREAYNRRSRERATARDGWPERVCAAPGCGVVFSPRGRNSRYCKPGHSRLKTPAACEVCNGPVGKHGNRFCSWDCSSKSRRRGIRSEWNAKTRRSARESAADGMSITARRRWLRRLISLGAMCFYCNDRRADTIDHIIPLTRGGTNQEGNLVPACRKCNCSKSDLLVTEWRFHRPHGGTITDRPWLPKFLLDPGGEHGTHWAPPEANRDEAFGWEPRPASVA